MKKLGPVRLVAGREITERLSGRAIWVLTALTTLLVVLGIVLPAVLRSTPSPTVVGLLGRSAQALGPSLEQTAKAAQIEITLVHLSDPADARDAVESGKVAAVLDVSDNKVDVEVKESLSTTAEGRSSGRQSTQITRPRCSDEQGWPPLSSHSLVSRCPYRSVS